MLLRGESSGHLPTYGPPCPPLFLICKNTRLTQSVGLTWGQVWTVIRVWVCQVLWHHVNLHPWPCECLLDGEVMTVCRSLSWREKAAKNRPRVGRMLVMHTKYTIHYICVSQHHLFSVHLFRMPSAWAFFSVLPVHSQKVQSSTMNKNFCCSEVRGLLFRPEAPKNNNPAKIKKRMCLCHWATQRVVADLAVFWKSTSDRDSQKTRGGNLCRIPEPWEEKWLSVTVRQVQRLCSHTCPGTAPDVNASPHTFSKQEPYHFVWDFWYQSWQTREDYIYTYIYVGLIKGFFAQSCFPKEDRWPYENRNKTFLHFKFRKCLFGCSKSW